MKDITIFFSHDYKPEIYPVAANSLLDFWDAQEEEYLRNLLHEINALAAGGIYDRI